VFAPPPPPDSAWFRPWPKTWGKSWVATFAEGVVLVSLLALPAWCCLTDAGYAAVGYKILSSDKRDAVKEYLAPLKEVVKVDIVKDKLKPLVLKIEKVNLRDHWLSCKIKVCDASKKLHLDAIPKKLQLSPDLVEALAAKKELCRAKFSDFLAYFQGERPPPSSPGPPEWVAVPSAPPKFEGS
jgi:hypothetical protein